MILLDHIPLIGVFLGIFVLFIIIPNRDGFVKNKQAKAFLIAIVILNIFENIDAYLGFNNIGIDEFYGISIVFSHLKGVLIFLFVSALTGNKSTIKKWLIITTVFTLARTAMLYYAELHADWENEQDMSLGLYIYWLDTYLSNFINLIFLLGSFFHIRRFKFALKLTDSEVKKFASLKRPLIFSIIVYIALIQHNIVSDINELEWKKQIKIDALLTNFLFFAVAVFASRFPLFSLSGDFKEDSSKEAKKYSTSSLKSEESEEIWNTIQSVITKEKSYLNPEFRLNDLANSCRKSIHHISQVINEIEGISFSDLINKYRVEEAKSLLTSEKANSFTILGIAYEVGFNSKTAFYNAFKKVCGVTPSEYKKQNS